MSHGTISIAEPISIADIQAHPAEAMAALIETVKRMSEEISKMGEEITHLQENFGIAMGLIAKLKPKEPDDSALLDELFQEMIAIDRKQVDFKTAARMVKRSKSRLLQIKPLIGQDMRFVLVPSESHSQKILIRLRDIKKPTN